VPFGTVLPLRQRGKDLPQCWQVKDRFGKRPLEEGRCSGRPGVRPPEADYDETRRLVQ
jgi:hypothetical protein